ncbi:MAG: DNA-binding winged helix-turn-helix (wHTH) protein [Bacteroidia bacterium]|jgi:DNA-binding winged helix-turn-helix (wHTH) protein
MINRMVFFLISLLFSSACFADGDVLSKKEQHIEVSMRMVGHQVLLSLGDSSSRVLPIEKKGEDKYQIRFENEFAFNPESIASVIDSVITATKIASNYIVQFESCETNQIVHAYEIGRTVDYNVLACETRNQPKACYNLLITILKPSTATSSVELVASRDYNLTDKYIVLVILLACVLLPMILVPLLLNRKTKSKTSVDQNIISIGQYRFNKRKMELWFEDQRVELTSKECDLLQLLCDSTNNTVGRETILKMVWGDDGDYVGRTLDVFISKLRKKLEGDSNIKIANIRGVGYKLVIDV